MNGADEFGRIFLHFFDIHYLDMKGVSYQSEVIKECRLATRFSILSANDILVPAASYFESRLCKLVLDELRPIFEVGIIRLVGRGSSIQEFSENKLKEYRKGTLQSVSYTSVKEGLIPPFVSRLASATHDINDFWIAQLESGDVIKRVRRDLADKPGINFEFLWETVPERLEGKAFIVDYVAPLLFSKRTVDKAVRNRLHHLINESYFGSFTKEYSAGIVTDLNYLRSPHRIPSYGKDLPYRPIYYQVLHDGLLEIINNANPIDLISLREDERWIIALEKAVKRPFGSKIDQIDYGPRIYTTGIKSEVHMLQAFIVHGHDRGTLLELKDYIQNTLRWPEPVILDQQPSGGRTVIEKFEETAEEIDVVFVLITPDDVGGEKDTELVRRARQNVIFELGYFVGKLGRRSGRLILLYKSGIEIPSDLNGVVYIDISKGIFEAGERIRREISNIGPK